MQRSLFSFISNIYVKNLFFGIFVDLYNVFKSFYLFFSQGYMDWCSLNLVDQIYIDA